MAANQSVQKLVDQITPAQKLESIKSKDVMIPFTKIAPYPITEPEKRNPEGSGEQNTGRTVDLDSDEPEGTTTGSSDPLLNIIITDALAFMKKNNITRLPLFTDKKLRFVIHQSAFEQFVTEQILSNKLFDVSKATINDMLTKGSERIKGFLINGAQFVSEDSNL